MSQIDAYTPAVELAALIREKKLSPVEVIDSLLARIDRINPKINAYCTLVPDEAREAARQAEAAVMRGDSLAPLHGVPVSLKDLVATKGIRTTSGSRVYQNFVPDEDAIIVERLRAAGAIVIGKTNTRGAFLQKGLSAIRVPLSKGKVVLALDRIDSGKCATIGRAVDGPAP